MTQLEFWHDLHSIRTELTLLTHQHNAKNTTLVMTKATKLEQITKNLIRELDNQYPGEET